MTATSRTGRGAQRAGDQVVDAAPRVRAKQRARTRERWRGRVRRTGWWGLGLAPLALVVWLVLASPFLQVDRVSVAGAGAATTAEVARVAQVPDGTSLARVDTASIERRVRSAVPSVRSVEVTRRWPSTLVVSVQERRAVAASLDGTTWRLVSDDGVVFATSATQPQGVVRLQVPSLGPSDRATLAALQVLRDLPAALRQRVVVVRAPSDVSVSFQVTGGRTVVWGAPGGTVDKAAAVTALLQRAHRIIDVSAPGVATTR